MQPQEHIVHRSALAGTHLLKTRYLNTLLQLGQSGHRSEGSGWPQGHCPVNEACAQHRRAGRNHLNSATIRSSHFSWAESLGNKGRSGPQRLQDR